MMMPLRERVLATVAARPARTREQGRQRAVVLFATASVVAASPLVLHGPFVLDDLGVAAGGLIVAVSCAIVALGRGPRLLGRSLPALLAAALAAPLARFVWLEHCPPGQGPTATAFACFVRTLLSSAPLACAAWMVKARSVIDHPIATGAALGACAAAFGAIVNDVSCAREGHAHIVVGHVVPVLVAALVGAFASRSLAVRAGRCPDGNGSRPDNPGGSATSRRA